MATRDNYCHHLTLYKCGKQYKIEEYKKTRQTPEACALCDVGHPGQLPENTRLQDHLDHSELRSG